MLKVSVRHLRAMYTQIVAEKEEEGSGGRIRAILLLNRSRAKLKVCVRHGCCPRRPD